MLNATAALLGSELGSGVLGRAGVAMGLIWASRGGGRWGVNIKV